jgi:RNA polymerase sigma-70 factor (ECF subfamily)
VGHFRDSCLPKDLTTQGSRVLDDEERSELERAYRAVGGDLWRALFAFTGGSREIAEDAVADAFIRAASRLTGIRDLRAWLYTVAFRIAAAELRRRHDAVAQEAPDGSAYSEDGEVWEVVEMARGLSRNQRAAFVLRDLMGYPASEAASLLGISQVAVRVHLSGAHRRLRASVR